MITEETFAREEQRLGRHVHLHDGVWWIRTAPFYYKPVHEFRTFPPRSARPQALKALLGYSHQVPDVSQATRTVVMNVLQGDDLRNFALERLGGKRRNKVRGGLRACRVETVKDIAPLLDQIKVINIALALRLEKGGAPVSFLPASYYEQHDAEWRQILLRRFTHQGHQLFAAFVEKRLAAYVDLQRTEDTWVFCSSKSSDECLMFHPVDALYFTILSQAGKDETCRRVVNGGGNEPESLTRFKADFLMQQVPVPYYTRTLLPIDRLRSVLTVFRRNRHRGRVRAASPAAKPVVETRDVGTVSHQEPQTLEPPSSSRNALVCPESRQSRNVQNQ